MQKKRIPIYLFGSVCIALIVALSIMALIISTGSFQMRKIKLVITTGSDTKEYDGTPLKCNEWALVKGEVMKEHTLKVTVRGERTAFGKSDNVADVVVLDKSGLEVTKQYDIEVQAGELEITRRTLTVTSDSYSAIYTGEPISDMHAKVTEGRLRLGDHFEPEGFGEYVDPGRYENTFVPVIRNDKGEDVTSNYELTVEYGKIIVRNGTLTLASGSKEKEYDGEELSYDYCYIEEGSLHAGDSIEMHAFGSITGTGKRINSIEAKITNSDGEDVTELYDINFNPGLLVITPRHLVIRTHDVTRQQGVANVVKDDWEIISGTLARGETITVRTMQQTVHEPGERENTVVSITINPANSGENVSSYYQISYYYGKAIIHW